MDANQLKSKIIEITEKEARQVCSSMYLITTGEPRKWGGLFIYQTTSRDHPKKKAWIAIDDSNGNCYIKEFKKKERSIEWLCHPAGPKLVRI